MGDTSCLAHTIAVVYCALAIARIMHLRVNKRELIRGGILHDYFLYDWHDGEKGRKIHGFTHPSSALANAETDFRLSRRERDIIKEAHVSSDRKAAYVPRGVAYMPCR